MFLTTASLPRVVCGSSERGLLSVIRPLQSEYRRRIAIYNDRREHAGSFGYCCLTGNVSWDLRLSELIQIDSLRSGETCWPATRQFSVTSPHYALEAVVTYFPRLAFLITIKVY